MCPPYRDQAFRPSPPVQVATHEGQHVVTPLRELFHHLGGRLPYALHEKWRPVTTNKGAENLDFWCAETFD